MRRILYVHGNSNIIGGIETFVETSVFHHKEFRPFIIFINDGLLPERIRKKGFKDVSVLNGSRLRHLHKTLLSILGIVRFIKEQAIDVVVGHGFHAWVYAGISAKLAGIESVHYVHGIMKKKRLRFPDMIEWIALRLKPTMFLANSEASLNGIKDVYGQEVSAKLLHPGVDCSKWGSKDPLKQVNLRAELGLPAHGKIVSVVGRIQEWKGQEYFIRAIPMILKEVSDAYFLIVGGPTFDKDYPYNKKLNQLTEVLEIKDKVRFAGFREDVAEIMSLSSVLVHASIEPEPFGLVLVEGMASGRPVIATDIGGPREIIVQNESGILIPPKDEDALAKAVVRVLQDEPFRNKLAENAKATIKARFSIETCISKMEDHLETLCSK